MDSFFIVSTSFYNAPIILNDIENNKLVAYSLTQFWIGVDDDIHQTMYDELIEFIANLALEFTFPMAELKTEIDEFESKKTSSMSKKQFCKKCGHELNNKRKCENCGKRYGFFGFFSK